MSAARSPVRGCVALFVVSVALRRPRVAPGAAAGLAVRLVLVRVNLGSKCECGFSLGLLAQAAFAIGFLDTSWDFNRCEVQKGNTTSGSVDQTAQLRPTINIVGVSSK